MNAGRRQLGQILLEQGAITREQLQTALGYQKRQGCGLGDALVALDFCAEVDVARALAEQNDIPFVDFQQTPPSPQAVQLISREVAVEYGIIPARLEGSRLVVAALNPYDLRLDEVLRRVSGMPVLMASATASQIRDLLNQYEQLKWGKVTRPSGPAVPSRPAPVSVPPGTRTAAAPPRRTVMPQTIPPELVAASEAPQVIQKAHALVADAVRRRASDLYFEPGEGGLAIRCRIYGRTYPITTIPRGQAEPLLVRLKIMSGLQMPLGGDVPTGLGRIRVDGASVELRSTLLPGVEGDLLSLRLVAPEPEVIGLEDLGMDPGGALALRTALAARQGLVVVAGPAGSGRPTTLYALLRYLRDSGLHVMALEETFERKLTGYNQVRVLDGGARSMAGALLTCLNQNPDAVLVGELPDRGALEVACRAAATGQLILVGSHAPDALSAVLRLLDMGLPAPDVVAGLAAVVAQRLAPRVCPACRLEATLPFALGRALRTLYPWPERPEFSHGKGCPQCHGLGHQGCVGLFEVLRVDADLRSFLAARPGSAALEERLAREGFRSLEEDGFTKACRGLIPPDELCRLGTRIPTALQSITARDEASSPEPDTWEPSLDSPLELLEPENWDEIADLARLAGADVLGGIAGGPAEPAFPAPGPLLAAHGQAC